MVGLTVQPFTGTCSHKLYPTNRAPRLRDNTDQRTREQELAGQETAKEEKLRQYLQRKGLDTFNTVNLVKVKRQRRILL